MTNTTAGTRPASFQVYHWQEPNRGNTKALNIADRGTRYATVTGIAWVDDFRVIVNHYSGLRMALFDIRVGNTPVAMTDVPHVSDAVAATPLADGSFDVAVSGCFIQSYSKFKLLLGDAPGFTFVQSVPPKDKSFSHGVAFDPSGRLWTSYSSGPSARIECEGQVWHLPKPWGARDVCFDPATGTAYAVAVSTTPKLVAYERPSVSVWRLDAASNEWQLFIEIENMHSDGCTIYQDQVWLTDQANNKVLAFNLQSGRQTVELADGMFDFPHGLGISRGGMLAVANYGTSSISLCQL